LLIRERFIFDTYLFFFLVEAKGYIYERECVNGSQMFAQPY